MRNMSVEEAEALQLGPPQFAFKTDKECPSCEAPLYVMRSTTPGREDGGTLTCPVCDYWTWTKLEGLTITDKNTPSWYGKVTSPPPPEKMDIREPQPERPEPADIKTPAVQTKPSVGSIIVTGSTGNTYTVKYKTPEGQSNPVAVSCTCPGFMFRGKCKHLGLANTKLLMRFKRGNRGDDGNNHKV